MLPSRETSPLSTLTDESLEALDQVESMPSCCAEYRYCTVSGHSHNLKTVILPHAACLQSKEVVPLKRTTSAKRQHDLNDESGKPLKKQQVSQDCPNITVRDIPVYSLDKDILCIMRVTSLPSLCAAWLVCRSLRISTTTTLPLS